MTPEQNGTMTLEEPTVTRNAQGAPAPNAAVSDVFPDFAVSLEEANRRVKMLAEFVRGHMVEGEDYGIVPGTNAKPTLFKSGAEKLNAIFGLAPIVEVVSRIEDWDKGFVSYEVKVTLINKRNGQVEAEGIGNCNSRERRYKNQDAANVANTILKMSKKRALVDATLSATRASGMFTQDLEDMDLDDRPGARGNPEREARVERGSDRGSDRSGFVPAREARAQSNAASSNFAGNPGTGGNALTEAQQNAILGYARRVFDGDMDTELPKMLGKRVEQLTKSEASAAIDRLRNMAGHSPNTR
jgi:hypothetical protein